MKMLAAVSMLAILCAAAAESRQMSTHYLTENDRAWFRTQNIAEGFIQRILEDMRETGQSAESVLAGYRQKDQIRSIAACLHIADRWRWQSAQVHSAFGSPANLSSLAERTLYDVQTGKSKLRPEEVGTGDDYDMDLADMLMVLVAFRDRADLLTNNAVWALIKQDDARHATQSGQAIKKKAHNTVTFPETENHVLMIHSWRYMVNDYVKWVGYYLHTYDRKHPRYDTRIVRLYENDKNWYDNANADSKLGDYLLQALGRFLHNGVFEENGRPYESLSFLAVMNCYSGANAFLYSEQGKRIRIAAHNALDFLIAKYAFQSFEGKRLAPFRRNYKHRRVIGVGASDYMPDMIGMLSGAYVFEDRWHVTTEVSSGKRLSRYSYRDALSQRCGFAMMAALFRSYADYRIPLGVHDLMVNKHSGYWARMYTHYTDKHYQLHENHSKYFDASSDQPIMSGGHKSSPEFYFCTPHFLNSAGGRYSQYHNRAEATKFWAGVGGNVWSAIGRSISFGTTDLGGGWIKDKGAAAEFASNQYNFNSVPFTILPRGDIGRFWGDKGDSRSEARKEIALMYGNLDHPHENYNCWTYKNFSYGSKRWDSSKDRHTGWPQDYPQEWNDKTKVVQVDGKIGRMQYRILDLRSRHGYFLIMGQVSKSAKDYCGAMRGFWEVVPEIPGVFNSVHTVQHVLKRTNKPEHFVDRPYDSAYVYTLVTSNDRVVLHPHSHRKGIQSIKAIYDHTGREQDLNTVLFEYGNEQALPLLDVREVDQRYRFTGRQYASCKDGYFTITNRHILDGGYKLHVNSRNYRSPSRWESIESRIVYRDYSLDDNDWNSITTKASADATIRCDLSARKNDNYGLDPHVSIGTHRNGGYGGIQTLIRFRLPHIPYAIRRAKLRLTVLHTYGFASDAYHVFSAREVLGGEDTLWKEGVGSESVDEWRHKDAVWADNAPGVNWNNRPSFTNTGKGVTSVLGRRLAKNATIEIDITAIAQKWVDRQSPNTGIIVNLEDSKPEFRQMWFYSKDYAEIAGGPDEGPKLILEY